MAQKALIFCIDAAGRVRSSRELEFTSRADLVQQLQPEIDRHALVEAWTGSVCLLRNGAPAHDAVSEDDAPGSPPSPGRAG